MDVRIEAAMLELRDNNPELCLNFTNTVHWHASAQPIETLHSYEELVRWAQEANAIAAADASQLVANAGRQPRTADAVLKRALALREAIYRLLVAQVRRAALPRAELATINAELKAALAHAQVEVAAPGLAWRWDDAGERLERVLWPIVASVASLVTASDQLARVGQCADDRGCGWLFLDTSYNHTRRWCDINDCGNRAKQRRYQERKRRASG